MGLCFGKKEEHKLYCANCGCIIEYDVYWSSNFDIACSKKCGKVLDIKKNDIKIYEPI